MATLNYVKGSKTEHVLQSKIYQVESDFKNDDLLSLFRPLKANIVDMNVSLITKAVQGTDQDFFALMKRAEKFIEENYKGIDETYKKKLLDMFTETVFGYYHITPLIQAKDISDIKILTWNKIVCKANGERYISDISFLDEQDYKDWFNRILRIHHLKKDEFNALNHCTDRKGVDDYYLRIDIETDKATSTEQNNLHIRKIPKEKYTWEYLKEAGMLDDDLLEYLRDRLINGYSFLISGRGGSGKSSLLNNMIDWIPFNESVLISQESDELYSNIHPQIQFEHTMEVERDGITKEYSLEDELRLGLLQDIDNFVIGEIKGGEALYVFTTGMSTGARFFGTLHSNDARGSVTRLVQCARYVSDYSPESLEEMLSNSPFTLIHMSHFSIDEILEVTGYDYENKKLIYHEVYKKGVF